MQVGEEKSLSPRAPKECVRDNGKCCRSLTNCLTRSVETPDSEATSRSVRPRTTTSTALSTCSPESLPRRDSVFRRLSVIGAARTTASSGISRYGASNSRRIRALRLDTRTAWLCRPGRSTARRCDCVRNRLQLLPFMDVTGTAVTYNRAATILAPAPCRKCHQYQWLRMVSYEGTLGPCLTPLPTIEKRK